MSHLGLDLEFLMVVMAGLNAGASSYTQLTRGEELILRFGNDHAVIFTAEDYNYHLAMLEQEGYLLLHDSKYRLSLKGWSVFNKLKYLDRTDSFSWLDGVGLDDALEYVPSGSEVIKSIQVNFDTGTIYGVTKGGDVIAKHRHKKEIEVLLQSI
jgi:hypothetical protein